jgi:putative endonuclease
LQYFVYIMSSASRTLYIGFTNSLGRRVWEHREQRPGSFCGRYRITRLVYFECTRNVSAAISREKQLKGWTRARKISLITSANPKWDDLAAAEGFFLPLESD